MTQTVVASGTVELYDEQSSTAFEEIVEVFEEDLDWAEKHGHETTVEDIARKQALRQAPSATCTVMSVDIS